jgi:hypothetical protein
MPEYASERARQLDATLENQVTSVALPSFKDVAAHVRVYLQRQNVDSGRNNNLYAILKTVKSGDLGTITLGPQFDKGPTESHFYARSGARLSFGITLREGNGRCRLVAYRFHFHLPEGAIPHFYRFDLNDRAHSTPLVEPRSHLHPGHDDIRLPTPVLNPIAVLDRVFYVIDPAI